MERLQVPGNPPLLFTYYPIYIPPSVCKLSSLGSYCRGIYIHIGTTTYI